MPASPTCRKLLFAAARGREILQASGWRYRPHVTGRGRPAKEETTMGDKNPKKKPKPKADKTKK
jgi:hypothetical protein